MQKTTHKRLLSALLAVVMVVALAPLTAFAAPATEVSLNGPTLNATYPYLVDGNPSSSDPGDAYTAHFNAGTLTLRGYDGGSINSNGGIHIILEGENTVTVTDKSNAINSGDNILISGDGTLRIDLNYSPGSGYVNGIYASNGSVAIMGGTVSIGVTTDDEGCGIRTADSITIGGDADVNIEVTTAGNTKSYGLRANNDITIESGELTVTAKSEGDNSYGIYAHGTNSLITNTGGIVEVNVKTGSTGGHSYGIYAYGSSSAIAIEGGKTTLKAESAKEHSFGLYSFASDITITDGVITLDVDSAEKHSFGIYTNGTDENITISGGEITLNTKGIQGDSYGIYAGNGSNVIIGDGVVDIDVVAGGAGIGIRAFNVDGDKGDVTISGGAVEINAAATNSSHGISAAGTITISTDEMLKIATNGQATNKEPVITADDYTITPDGAAYNSSSITYTYGSGSGSDTYTVTYNANGGSGTMSPQTFTDGVAQALTANAFTRANYTFGGWAISSGGSVVYADGENVTIASNITLYAVWAEDDTLDISTGSITIAAPGTYRIVGATTENTITVNAGVSANIILDNVSIDRSAQTGSPFQIADNSSGIVKVTLVGDNTLKAGSNGAGLQKNGNAGDIGTLTIDGDGALTAIGGNNGAGIGGGNNGYGMNITIESGTVTAGGGNNGAGIGGGANRYGSNIIINGGKVEATGGDYAAGIGGGDVGYGGMHITISGGEVKATGGESAAGIGGGYQGIGYNINISDGTVTAIGGEYGAGIGGGYSGSGSDITISGGTVTATGGDNGAGIGGGDEGSGSNITISPNEGKQITVYTGNTAPGTLLGTYISSTPYTSTNIYFHSVEEDAGSGPVTPTITGVTVSPSSTSVQKGTTQTFVASVSGTGSYDDTVTWSVSGGGSGTEISTFGELTVAAEETAETLTVTAEANGDSSKKDTATVTVTDTVVTKYTLTVNSGSGGGEYAENTEVTITANAPASGKQFKEWTTSDGGSFADATSASTTFTMPASAATVTATYEDIPAATYALTVNLNGGNGGTVSGDYAESAVVSINAGTKSNYSFNGWTTSNGGIFANANNASTTFTMPGNATTITANWSYNGGGGGGGSSYDYYTITASAGTGGSISPSGSASIREGRDKTFTITADTGYVVDDVLVDGKSVGSVKSYTFENIRKSHTIKATFVRAGQVNPQTGVDFPFADVTESDWFFESVKYVFDKGLMAGTGDTTFAPNITTTRGMIVTVLHRMEGSPAVTGANPFDDVAAGKWYAEAVKWAAENKIVGGYGNGRFGPEDSITREQMAAILMNYAKLKGYDVSGKADLSKFSDADKISDWATEPLAWANAKGLVSGTGDGVLDPRGEATRAQVAAILMRFCESYK